MVLYAYVRDFNPRSPCGERPVAGKAPHLRRSISIHAPRVGSDGSVFPPSGAKRHFNPRSPCGERPGSVFPPSGAKRHFNPRSPCGERPADGRSTTALNGISIHAPRVGSDSVMRVTTNSTRNFNPRSPCGERPIAVYGEKAQLQFQSTLPVWGATKDPSMVSAASRLFQSTLPVWGATS